MGNRRGRGLPAPPLTEALILAWADAYHARAGSWPYKGAGALATPAGETWAALRLGLRGLTGGESLAGLLERSRGGGKAPRLVALGQSQDVKRNAAGPIARTGPAEKRVSVTPASPGFRRFLEALPAWAGSASGMIISWVFCGFGLIHAPLIGRFTHGLPCWDPTDPAVYYISERPDDPEGRAACFQTTTQRVLFVGHFHRWLIFTPEGRLPWDGTAPVRLRPEERYLVVVGAVCDGWCALFDTGTRDLVPFRLPGEVRVSAL
jgi:hypothetical protein